LQNLESAAAAGDDYKTAPSLLMNGVGTIVAAMFSSPFPTTIYIGHPAWKSMGARSAYSVMNGVFMLLLCSFGAVTLILKFMPLEVGAGILLWIGIIMIAQCFNDTPKSHALAVGFGLIPSLAAWALFIVETSLRVAGKSLVDLFPVFMQNNFYIHGLISLSQGFLMTSICFTALMVYILERDFIKASLWSVILAIFSFLGIIHSYKLDASGIHYEMGWMVAPKFAVAYFMSAIILMCFYFILKSQNRDSIKSDLNP
jgi:adenine/guanine/hypoxanthine permease